MYTVNILSEVLSIRISKELKEAMKSVDIDWKKEIELFIRNKIRDYLKRKYLERARRKRNKLPKLPMSHSELIREDRDAR